jgi:phosphopantothenoylcysteine decarboxylase/phosphopantothenate--cysteine ligase
MGGDRNTVHLLTRNGADIAVDSWPVMTKEQVAVALIAEVARSVTELTEQERMA